MDMIVRICKSLLGLCLQVIFKTSAFCLESIHEVTVAPLPLFTPATAMMKRPLERKINRTFFSEDQIDSLQLLYANFRVAHSIEPAMKAFMKGLQTKDLAEASKITQSNDKITNVVLSVGTEKSLDMVSIRQVARHLMLRYEPSSISDLNSLFQTLHQITNTLEQISMLKNSFVECKELEAKISRVSLEQNRLDIENRVLHRRLNNATRIHQNFTTDSN